MGYTEVTLQIVIGAESREQALTQKDNLVQAINELEIEGKLDSISTREIGVQEDGGANTNWHHIIVWFDDNMNDWCKEVHDFECNYISETASWTTTKRLTISDAEHVQQYHYEDTGRTLPIYKFAQNERPC